MASQYMPESNSATEPVIPALTVSPTLVVGLGGTGCKIARRLKQTLLSETPTEDHDRIMVRFVGIDTDNREKEVTVSEEAPLDFFAQISGETASFNPKDPSCAPLLHWLPTDDEGRLKNMRRLTAGQGAGGCRLMGRFAYNYFGPAHFPSIEAQIKNLLDLRKNPLRSFKGARIATSNDLTIFVVGSLAGGTGSGSFIDAIATCHYLADRAAPGMNRHINGVFALPSVFAGRIDTANLQTQRATAYSCLRDLEVLLATNRDDLLTFKYFNHEYQLRTRLLNNVYLVDLNTKGGGIVEDDDLYRLVAAQLYAMIGSPIGAHKLSVANNDWITNAKDLAGGNRFYCSLGLVGIAYDQRTVLDYAASVLGWKALAHLEGLSEESASAQESVRSQARQILSEFGFVDGASATFLRDVMGAQELAQEDTAEDIQEMKLAVARAKLREEFDRARSSQQRSQERARANTRMHLVGQVHRQRAVGRTVDSKHWRDGLRKRLLRYLAEHGISPALAVAESVCDQLNQLSHSLESSLESLRQAVSSAETNFESAIGRLESSGAIDHLFRRAELHQTKLDAHSHLSNYRSNLNRMLAIQEGRTAITDPHDGLFAVADSIRSGLNGLKATFDGARRELDRIKRNIEQHGHYTEAARGALDTSNLIYSLMEPWRYRAMVEALPETKVSDLEEAILRPGTLLDEADNDLGVAKGIAIVRLSERLRHSKKTSSAMLAQLVSQEASNILPEWRDRHILDLMREGADDPEAMSSKFRQIMRLVAPKLQALTTAIEKPGEPDYKMAFVMYPEFDPLAATRYKLDREMVNRFSREAEDAVKAELKTNAVTILPGIGRNNRILILCSRRGIPLTEFRVAELATLRNAYMSMRKRNVCFDVDKRWMRFPGPGMRSVGEARETLFALGLAYGLIAQQGTAYYNNLPTSLDRDAPAEASERERYEVDIRDLVEGFSDASHPQDWFCKVCLGPSAATNIPQLLGYGLGKYARVTRNKRDRLGQGRAAAMESFVGDVEEDFEDVAEGIRFFMKKYLLARGVGGVAEELRRYHQQLDVARRKQTQQAEQLEREYDLLDALLVELTKSGSWSFDEEV